MQEKSFQTTKIGKCFSHSCCQSGQGDHPNALPNVLSTTALTMALNIITTQFPKGPGPGNGTCWRIYPMCDTWALQGHIQLPQFIGQPTSCEICLLLVALITCLHWSCVFTLFSQPRWKTQFLPQIITATLVTLLPLATLVRDPATVFLRLLPIVTDVYISACYILDCAYERGRECSSVVHLRSYLVIDTEA